MTAPARVRCAAAGRFQDQHQAISTWWTVTSPDGDELALCSLCWILEWVTFQDWPADLAISSQPRHTAPPSGSEAA